MGLNLVFVGLLIATSLYAFVRGGAPERIGAASFATACILTVVVASLPAARFRSVELGMLLVDISVFLVFVILALKANRFWPIWVSALLGIGVAGHLARLLSPDVIPWAYQLALTIWSYPILLLVCLGTYAHQKRLAKTGADPSWTRYSAPAGPSMPSAGPTA